MKFVLFYHSFASCWNHGNAHFLRGVCRELLGHGHEVTVYEPEDGWSRLNALQDNGAAAIAEASHLVPGVQLRSYRPAAIDLDAMLDGADVVLVHEWNDPELVAAIGAARAAGGRFTLLFHDTHHRAVSSPEDIERFDLSGYDAVLAFGEVLRELYVRRGWGRRAFTWHEAADTALFHPMPEIAKDIDLVWIGNWGDGEREQELHDFLREPVKALGIRGRIHGVRYPQKVRDELAGYGIEYAGWLPNHRAPEAFARGHVTVHVPRRPYVQALPGIPTIRVFEALACGIPLVSAPWNDAEGLFPPGSFVSVRTGGEAKQTLATVLRDEDYAQHLVCTGLDAIKARHTCAHRVEELLHILEQLQRETSTTRSTSSAERRMHA